MKNILVLAHDDEGQEARLQAALDLGRALTGHITCLDVTYIPPILGNDYSEAGYAMAAVLADETTREGANGVILLGWSTAFFVAMVARITIVEREFTERPATPRPGADPYKPQ